MNNYQRGYTDATRGYVYRESLPSPAWRDEKMLRDYERGWQKGREKLDPELQPFTVGVNTALGTFYVAATHGSRHRSYWNEIDGTRSQDRKKVERIVRALNAQLASEAR